MKHKLLWTTISVAFLTEPEDRTKEQAEISRDGLCWSWPESIPNGLSVAGFLCNLNRTDGLYWLPITGQSDHTRQHDLIRGDFAQLMACMSEKEFNELTKG